MTQVNYYFKPNLSVSVAPPFLFLCHWGHASSHPFRFCQHGYSWKKHIGFSHLCASSLSAWCCCRAKGIWKPWSSHNATTLLLASSITTWKLQLKHTHQRESPIEKDGCLLSWHSEPGLLFQWPPWLSITEFPVSSGVDLTCSWWYWGVCLWGSVLISSLGLLRQELSFQPGWNFSMETSCFIRFLHNPRLENVLNQGPKPSMHLRKVSFSDPLIKLCLSVGDGDPSTKNGWRKRGGQKQILFLFLYTVHFSLNVGFPYRLECDGLPLS